MSRRRRVLGGLSVALAIALLVAGLYRFGVRGGDLRPRGTLEDLLALRSEEHTSELQSLRHLVCRLLLEKKKKISHKKKLKYINKKLDTQDIIIQVHEDR